MKSTMKLLSLLTTSLFLFSCGGGGGGSSDDTVLRVVSQEIQEDDTYGDAKRVTFKYDELGRIIRRGENFFDADIEVEYYEFEYDDQGALYTQIKYNSFSGVPIRYSEYDSQGELIILSSGDGNGGFIEPAETIMVNTYSDSIEIDQELLQLKLSKDFIGNTLFALIYPDSKLTHRERSGNIEDIFTYSVDDTVVDNSIVTISAYDGLTNDLTVPDSILTATFNDFYDIKFQEFTNNGTTSVDYNFDYSYERDANNNVVKRVRTNLDSPDEVTTTIFTWGEVPVK